MHRFYLRFDRTVKRIYLSGTIDRRYACGQIHCLRDMRFMLDYSKERSFRKPRELDQCTPNNRAKLTTR